MWMCVYVSLCLCLSVCVYVCVCVCVCTCRQVDMDTCVVVWRSEKSLQLGLSLHHLGLRNRTPVIRLGSKCLYSPYYLAILFL